MRQRPNFAAVAFLLSACVALPSKSMAIGALAISHNASGMSGDWPTAAVAQAHAMHACQSHGDGTCRVVATFQNQCVAVSAGATTGEFWTLASNLAAAQQRVMAKCHAAHQSGCHLVDSGCDPR